MLRIRYDADPDFCAILHFVGNLDEELAAIDQLLSDETLLKLIAADLSQRYPHTTQTGRNSTPVEVIVRMLVLKHLRSISYSKTIKQVNESIVLRQFCRVYFNPLPTKSTLLRWANLIQGVQRLIQNIKSLPAEKLSQALRLFIPRVIQVIDQTHRRVLQLQKVPSSEKLVSIFESHSDIICRGKTNVLVEFGHKVWLDEVDGGIISNYRVLYGNPHDTQQWRESLEQHQQQFSHPPKQASADRGVFSQPNETFAKELGVQHIILPKFGYKSGQRQQHEKQRYFRQGRYWHNGVEGRISYLKRSFGFNRCLYRGDLGFERWVALGIIAHNLTIISRNLVQRISSRFKPN